MFIKHQCVGVWEENLIEKLNSAKVFSQIYEDGKFWITPNEACWGEFVLKMDDVVN